MNIQKNKSVHTTPRNTSSSEITVAMTLVTVVLLQEENKSLPRVKENKSDRKKEIEGDTWHS